MKTNKDVTVNFRDYGDIVVPKGTRLTHKTACGIDEKYHFVDDLTWIKDKYPKIALILIHDALYYGINIPIEFVDYEGENDVKKEKNLDNSIQDKYNELCKEITRLQEKYDENGYDCSPMTKLQRIEQHVDGTIQILRNK